MSKIYGVREGFSVKLPDRPEVYLAGGVIELDDATAELHKHKLEPLSEEAQKAFDDERAKAADEAALRDLEADQARQASLDADAAAAKEAAKQAAAIAKAG
jgi:hypothetical protein